MPVPIIKNIKPWQVTGSELSEDRAGVRDFVLSEEFLGLGEAVFPEIIDTLEEIMGRGHEEAVLCWGIGSGKSFLASLALCYMAHSVLCMKDPQGTLGLAPEANMTLITMAPSARQARNIVFGEVSKLVQGSPWFGEHAPEMQCLAEEIRFPRNLVMTSGNSSATFALGYNVLGAVIDEVAWFPLIGGTREESVEEIYYGLKHRMSSRFMDRGLMVLISSPRTAGDFLQRRLALVGTAPGIYGSRKAVWEVRPRERFSGDTFTHEGLEIPVEYKRDFDLNPQRALRDLGARPSRAIAPFFADPTVLDAVIDEGRSHPFDSSGQLCGWLHTDSNYPRYVHIDLGLTRDACGIAMAYCRAADGTTDEPMVVVELMHRIVAPAHGEIDLSLPRELIVSLRMRGFNIAQVSYDGWQSADSRQILARKGFSTKLVSVDRTLEAYETLKEVILDGRLTMYRYEPFLEEARALEFARGRKVDHPPKGSKDVADAVAGCVSEAVRSWGCASMTAKIV